MQTLMLARMPVSSRTGWGCQGATIPPALTLAETATRNRGRKAAAATLVKEAEATVASSHQPADDDNVERREAEADVVVETAAKT
jgi:hypothetical protein